MKATPLLSLLAATATLLPAAAQQPPARPTFETSVSVAPERPTAEAPNVNPPPAAAVPAAPPAAAPVTTTPGAAAPAQATGRAANPVRTVNGGVLLNFQNASLNDVLTYLSEALGFVIVQEAPVSGTINLVSQQPLNAEEVVDVLNSTLVEKGYAAIRNGRILKIVNRRDAARRDLPVNSGSDPDKIQRNDTVVTQILPLHYGEAGKLVENLRPLLSETAVISANDGSNAILMTDTQTNIRRIAQIIRALDTSVSSISTITVFPLKYADCKAVAASITQLFAPAPSQQQNRGGGQGRGGFGGFGGFGFGGGGGQGGGGGGGQGGGNAPVNSAALTAASRVVAVADEQSNSVIVSSPAETIPVIREMIDQIDTSITALTDTRIFRLVNADAVEMAATITSLYTDGGATGTANSRRGQTGNNNRGFGFPFGGGGTTTTSTQSDRTQQQGKVTAVGDPRTNSLLVTAAKESMMNIAEIVGRLDTTTARKQRVYTVQLKNTQPDTVADVLRGMLGQPTQSTNSGSSVLTTRSQNGATMTTDDFSSSSSNGRTGSR